MEYNMNNSKVISSFTGKYWFLSNYYLQKRMPIEINGLQFTSGEAAFQCGKIYMPDGSYDEVKETLFTIYDPNLAKRLGRKVNIRPDWEVVKDARMLDVIRAKFKHKKLRHMLLGTGTAILIEGNHWHDNYWGDCNCPECRNIKGLNHLGQILMKVREEIRSEEEAKRNVNIEE